MITKDTCFQKGESGNRKGHPKGTEGLPPIDLAIFDEAHKTTGRAGGMFSYALDDENIQRPEDRSVIRSVVDKVIQPDVVAILWPQPYAGDPPLPWSILSPAHTQTP